MRAHAHLDTKRREPYLLEDKDRYSVLELPKRSLPKLPKCCTRCYMLPSSRFPDDCAIAGLLCGMPSGAATSSCPFGTPSSTSPSRQAPPSCGKQACKQAWQAPLHTGKNKTTPHPEGPALNYPCTCNPFPCVHM